MSWVISENTLGFPGIRDVAATATIPVGTIVKAQHPAFGEGEFILLRGAAGTVEGSWVVYNADDWSTTLLAPNAIGPIAVAMAPTVAGRFGWYQINGKAMGLCLAGFLDNANVYATATPGSVDDAVVAGDRVQLAKGASDRDTLTGMAEFEIHRPFGDDALAP